MAALASSSSWLTGIVTTKRRQGWPRSGNCLCPSLVKRDSSKAVISICSLFRMVRWRCCHSKRWSPALLVGTLWAENNDTAPHNQTTYLLDVGPPIDYAPSATVLLNLASTPARGEAAGHHFLTVGDPAYGATANKLPARGLAMHVAARRRLSPPRTPMRHAMRPAAVSCGASRSRAWKAPGSRRSFRSKDMTSRN